MKHKKIYLRTIVNNDDTKLSLFDSDGQGDINNLVTVGEAGGRIVWRPDVFSGIKRIVSIYPKLKNDTKLFKHELKRSRFNRNQLSLKIPKDFHGKEEYGIIFETRDGRIIDVGPHIIVPEPPPQEP